MASRVCGVLARFEAIVIRRKRQKIPSLDLIQKHAAPHPIRHGKGTPLTRPPWMIQQYAKCVFVHNPVCRSKSSPAPVGLDGPTDTLDLINRLRQRRRRQRKSALPRAKSALQVQGSGEHWGNINPASKQLSGIKFASCGLSIRLHVRLCQDDSALHLSKRSTSEHRHGGVYETAGRVDPPLQNGNACPVNVNLSSRRLIAEISVRRCRSSKHG